MNGLVEERKRSMCKDPTVVAKITPLLLLIVRYCLVNPLEIQYILRCTVMVLFFYFFKINYYAIQTTGCAFLVFVYSFLLVPANNRVTKIKLNMLAGPTDIIITTIGSSC